MKIFFYVVSTLLTLTVPAFAVVTVSSPSSGATVVSPVHYVASAATTTCAKGVASMGIYVDNKLIYVVSGTKLNTEIALSVGAQHTVVEEWDLCGGATFTTIDLSAAGNAISNGR